MSKHEDAFTHQNRIPRRYGILKELVAEFISLFLGLIDAGESPEDAATRELQEETGFVADAVIDSSDLMVSDPGPHLSLRFSATEYTT